MGGFGAECNLVLLKGEETFDERASVVRGGSCGGDRDGGLLGPEPAKREDGKGAAVLEAVLVDIYDSPRHIVQPTFSGKKPDEPPTTAPLKRNFSTEAVMWTLTWQDRFEQLDKEN